MKKTTDIFIDGKTYKVNQFLGVKTLKMSYRLMKYLGKPLAKLFFSGDDEAVKSLKGGTFAFDEKAIPEAIDFVFSNMKEEDFLQLVNEMLEDVSFIDEKGQHRNVNVNMDFAGDLVGLFKLLIEIGKFQFNFLPDRAAAIPEAAAAMARVTAI